MHGEGNICLGFLFGRKAKIAYLSDVSRFLPETEYGMIFLPTIVYLQIYAWQKWYFIELMFKVMVISEIIMIYMNAENQNNLQVVWIIAKPVSLFFTVQSWELKNKILWFVNRFFLLDSHFRCRFAETGHFIFGFNTLRNCACLQ